MSAEYATTSHWYVSFNQCKRPEVSSPPEYATTIFIRPLVVKPLPAKITKNLDSPPRFAYQDAMIRRRLTWLTVALVLGINLALMWTPMRDDTATMDETVFLGAGYSYWQGPGYY